MPDEASPSPAASAAAALVAARDRDHARVLVVEPEEGMREGMRRILERRGCAVRTSADGEGALRLLAEEPADVALVPLSGPGTDKEDADARADVAAHLTTDQMAQALRLAQEWRANRAASRVSAIRVAPTAPIVSVAPAPRVPPVTLPAPALRTTVRWSAGDPSSEQRWVEGMLVEAITLRGIQVATSICEMPNGLFSAFVYVHNMDDAPMAVIPSNFSIQITNPPGKQFASLPPEKGMVRGGWGTAIAGAIAGGAQGWSDASQKKTASATVTNPDGTTSQVDIYTTGPTQQEIDQRNRAAQQRNDEAAERNRYNQGIQQAAIRSTMLDPQQVVSGVVFFPREQTKYHEVVINIPIREAVFQFPFQFK